MPRILILESYEPIRQALAVILEREGWEVTLSETEQEMSEALMHNRYDVLLIDLEMHSSDEWQILQHLVPDRATPIIAILDQESQRSHKAQELGARAVLYKPLRRKRLLDSATAALKLG